MSWDADIARLGKLAANLRQLGDVPSRAAGQVGAQLGLAVNRQFASSTDPYGRPWAKLKQSTVKRKSGDSRILIRSGTMRASVSVRPMSGGGVSIVIESYAGFHQTGTKHMVARTVLPANTMPRAWREIIQRAVSAAYAKAVQP